jgi:hypothetical protein
MISPDGAGISRTTACPERTDGDPGPRCSGLREERRAPVRHVARRAPSEVAAARLATAWLPVRTAIPAVGMWIGATGRSLPNGRPLLPTPLVRSAQRSSCERPALGLVDGCCEAWEALQRVDGQFGLHRVRSSMCSRTLASRGKCPNRRLADASRSTSLIVADRSVSSAQGVRPRSPWVSALPGRTAVDVATRQSAPVAAVRNERVYGWRDPGPA